MCFDALTIGGLLFAVVSGGFMVGVVSHNDRSSATHGELQVKPSATAAPQDS
jgi:hypothetical protein